MTILQLCSYYVDSKIYLRLFEALGKNGIIQNVYIPVRTAREKGINFTDKNDISLQYRNIIRPQHRILYHAKIKKFKKELLNYNNEELKEANCIHAHTLFTDGALAYELHMLTGKPYIVAVRNTDVNYFLRFAPHLRRYIRKVLDSAREIIFISPSIADRFFTHFDKQQFTDTQVIANGINDHWFSSSNMNRTLPKKPFPEILFVGELNRNKNLIFLLRALETVRQKYPQANIRIIGPDGTKIVGPDGDQSRMVNKYAANRDYIEIIGKVEDSDRLKQYYQSADVFAMISHTETFGLVYAEALSQGTPIVYTRGQGFDSIFPEGEVGYSCSSHSIDDIANAIISTLDGRFDHEELINRSMRFRWHAIAEQYLKIYADMRS